ncbi:MAG: hypothetical protein WCC52_07205, partial [Nitrosotalea sp.]
SQNNDRPLDESERNWLLAAANRVMAFSQNGPLQVKINDNVIAEIDLRGILSANPVDGTTINITDPGIKVKGDLVGLGGMYYYPSFFGADNTTQVVESWNWLLSQLKTPKEELEVMIEGYCVMDFIFSGKNMPEMYRIMSLATDLKILYEMNMNIQSKISELSEKTKGNFRAFTRFNSKNNPEGITRIREIIYQLADLSAEVRLAVIAKRIGKDVQISKSPDLLIDGVRVEVKFDRGDGLDNDAFVNKLLKGLNQGGELIAIDTLDLNIKNTRSIKLTWLSITDLRSALETGSKAVKNGRKCVLLLSGSNKGYFGRLGLVH